MKVYCGWCQKKGIKKLLREVRDGTESESFGGICIQCANKELAKIEKRKKGAK